MKTLLRLLVCGLLCNCCSAPSGRAAKGFTDSFATDKTDLSPVGKNQPFIPELAHVQVLKGKSGGKTTVLTITVLKETKLVDGVETRVVEEKETVNSQPLETSRNLFAISKKTGDVFYFGEEVDEYKNGKVASRGGA